MSRYDSDGADCARAMSDFNATKHGPAIALSGVQAHTITEAFAEADRALREAETSKVPNIRRRAKDARSLVTTAWAHVKAAMASAARENEKRSPGRGTSAGETSGGAGHGEGLGLAPPHGAEATP